MAHSAYTMVASRTETEATSTLENHEINSSSETLADARELAERIHRSADILLERLLSHLSRLPESSAAAEMSAETTEEEEKDIVEESESEGRNCNPIPNDKTKVTDYSDEETCMLKRGVTLPVSSISWLSSQLEALERRQSQQTPETTNCNDETQTESIRNHDNCTCDIEPWLGTEATASLRYRLSLLRFLLPRAQLIRLTRTPWPPQSSSRGYEVANPSASASASFLCSASSSKKHLKKWWRKRQRQNITEPLTLTESVASDFLRYARQFEHGSSKCVNICRVFPNATVLILESVPPSWIEINAKRVGTERTTSARNHKQPSLRLISVTNAAIYDLKDFLPPLSEQVPPSTAIATMALSSSLQSPLSHSLTHLKLENCSLGELTKGFASSLAQLVHLEYLSLSHNQFRSAKTLLKGLRPLTKLRYLDASANRLVGCFGPYANLCLGGQVRTLKLSDNLLTTCQNSGLEKCYALRELWLDSNHIEGVVDVSCLAGLPDLECLALQRNPFSTRVARASTPKTNSSPSPPSVTIDRENTERTTIGHTVSVKDDEFYDPDWKIRLWTWFQHERRAVTPLELPVLNKKTKRKGFHHNGCDVATIGRMTREEWDRIQEKSYSIATIATATATVTTSVTSSLRTPSGHTGALTTEEGLPRTKESLSAGTPVACTPFRKTTTQTLTTDFSLSLRSPLLAPIRNRRVTKKSRTRQATIHTIENKSKDNPFANVASVNKIRSHKTNRVRTLRQTKSKKSSSELLVEENSPELPKDANGDHMQSSLKATKDYSASLIGVDWHNTGSNVTSDLISQDPFSCEESTRTSFSEKKKQQQLSFSLQDVLVSLQHEHKSIQECQPSTVESKTLVVETLNNQDKEDNENNQNKESLLSSKEVSSESAADDDAPTNPFLENFDTQNELAPNHGDAKVTERDNSDSKNCEKDTKISEADGYDETKESKIPEPTLLHTEDSRTDNMHILKEEKGKDKKCDDINNQQSRSTDGASNTESAISSSRSSPKRSSSRKSPRRSPRKSPRRPLPIDEDRIFVRPKMASIKLSRMSNYKPFDALKSDWDDVLKKALEGRIPDGLLKSPVDQSSTDFAMNVDIFSDKAADLLAPTTNESKIVDPTSTSRSTSDPTLDQSIFSNNRLTNTLPEHVWQDDNSVLSSLGASRDDMLPRGLNKFQLAEENCSYDGPDSSRGMKVVENLQLYFETFVFQTSMPDIPVDVLEDMEEDQDDWQLISMYYPRIQLWPDDRRLLELERVHISSSMNSADWTTNRERFLRVWEEEIVPCGKPALRRLPPNRRNRLGFHGDKLFESADVDAYAECRKVLLCLSSKAFYIIPEKDDVTLGHKQQAKKRRFPLPLDRGDRFRDAPWPHAVARHCLGELEAICIGFEFQRLTLRFRNQSLPKSDPFVYVLLTGNKRTSVRIFQEIQKLAKDLIENNAMSNPSANNKNSSTIAIENDSHIVFDSLNSLIDSADGSGIGTILHFQIVQQQWKHGGRGKVRRVCVITDTKILLLDEDYAADGHDLSSVTVKGEHMSDARYRLVDQAALSLVSQVQAAGTDPRAITISIKPSTLSRTHRWRLVCRDREGAESLVEDARRALEGI